MILLSLLDIWRWRAGIDYELGQILTLQIQDKDKEIVSQEYVLCGVIREYTNLWYTGEERGMTLAGALVTENAALKIGNACSYQYFLYAEEKGDNALYRQLKKNYNAVENTSAYGLMAKEEYHYFNLALILITTIVAVIVIFSMQEKDQMRSIQLFRTIGATKKQLSKW